MNIPKNAIIEGFEASQIETIEGLFSDRLKALFNEIWLLYRKPIKYKSCVSENHGGFYPDSVNDECLLIDLNPITGLNESNIAHELFHIKLFKEGFPVIKSISTMSDEDERRKVAIQLTSNILHIPLAKEIFQKGFDIEYLRPTLQQMEKTLSVREKEVVRQISPFSIHLEAVALLRIYYEAKYLSEEESKKYKILFSKKSPQAFRLCKKLREIIKQHDCYRPEGNVKALFYCFQLLNKNVFSPFNMSQPYMAYLQQLTDNYNLKFH